MSSMLLLT
uniref:Uncharacterized protein n=1 Tax=Anguilla anguilla TaxID=7936 RepID=A0A0E9W3H9_ANGAN